jgi:prolyl-tRNA editing enzyme YbaK/EbsC (Cys-tRNA(Pro) deacylase)
MSSASAVLTSPSVQRVRQALQRAGLDADIVELPGAARTARAAAEFLGCDVAQIANSLVFRGETSGTALLVMSSGDGLTRVFVEKSLSAFDQLWAAAGHPHTVFRLSFEQLLRITNGVPAELAA